MRPHYQITLQLGLLRDKYNIELDIGDLADDFTIYDSFHDTAIHENSYLRGLAKQRGEIDALRYITMDSVEHLPTTWDWLKADPEQTLRHVYDAYSEANHGGEGYTWLDYLRGWNTALQFALDDEERPWGSRCYKRPEPQI